MSKSARVHKNIWGNLNGYIGTAKVADFGTDEFRAKEWLAEILASGGYELSNKSYINQQALTKHKGGR